MAPKKKTKYPADREMQSNTALEDGILTEIYSSVPKTVITINADLPEACQSDIRAALDEVLKYHGH